MDDTVKPAREPQPRAMTTRLILSNGRVLAVENLWPAHGVWLAAVIFGILSRVVDERLASNSLWLRFVWTLLSLPIGVWISASVTRALLGYAHGFWNLNRDFW